MGREIPGLLDSGMILDARLEFEEFSGAMQTPLKTVADGWNMLDMSFYISGGGLEHDFHFPKNN